MNTTHQLTVRRRCPVDDAYDVYEVTIETYKMIEVERILGAIAALPEKLFQEDLTQQLATALGCTVRTVGYHSGVKTTCVC